MESIGRQGYGTLDADAVGALMELLGNDRDALAEIVETFVDEAPERIAELRRGVDADDGVLVARAAHTLKANGRTFGATQLASICQEIETAARSGDLAAAFGRVEEVEKAWSAVRRELAALPESAGDGG